MYNIFKTVLIFSLMCIMMLCSAATFAEEPETVGRTITLTQFLGVSREDAESVAITITMYDTYAKTAYIDKDAFYDISDKFLLTSVFEPEPLTMEGIYIAVEKTDFILKPFIDENGRTLVPAKEFCGLIRKSFLQPENSFLIAINPHSDTALESEGNLGDSVIFRAGEKLRDKRKNARNGRGGTACWRKRIYSASRCCRAAGV